MRGIIYHIARQLQEQKYLRAFHWVPAHLGIIKNEKANLTARNKALKGGKQAEH